MRRLPIIQETASTPPARGWRLVALGIGLVFTLWLPLALLALPLGPRLAQAVFHLPQDLQASDALLQMAGKRRLAFAVTLASPSIIAFGLAAVLGGALLQRQRARPGQAALSSAGAGSLAWALAWLGGALNPWPVAASVLAFLAVFGSAAGAIGAKMTRALVEARVRRAARGAPRV